MANELAGQKAKFTKALTEYNSTEDEARKQVAARVRCAKSFLRRLQMASPKPKSQEERMFLEKCAGWSMRKYLLRAWRRKIQNNWSASSRGMSIQPTCWRRAPAIKSYTPMVTVARQIA
jgi:hypothetical protein